MSEFIINVLRGSVSSIMYVILLLTITKSKFGRSGTVLIAIFLFVLNIGSNIWFYLYGDLTALSRYTLVLFIVVGLILKFLTHMNFLQWSFSFLTTINLAMMIIILSFHLGKLTPNPQYANIIFRFLFYLIVIVLFKKYLLSAYHTVVSNWAMFSSLMICIFLNLAYYFYVTDDIQETLVTYRWPMLLIVALSLSAYATLFFSLKRFATMYTLELENEKFQKEADKLHQAALELEQHANYDPLTGLPNRRYFFEHLRSIEHSYQKEAKRIAILFIDLDSFKDINDAYGHEVGDEVLIVTGKRLSRCMRVTDVVARIGGDEFAIILQNIEDQLSAELFARNLYAEIKEDMQVNNVVCSVDASIGIAHCPDDSTNGETLLRIADAAMYAQKRAGKGGLYSFSGSIS